MASIIDYATQGSRIFLTSWKNRLFKKRYEGTANEICKKVVEDCWNGRYFQVSTGNFSQFWTRDFGWSTQSLVKLGFEKEVHKTLRYAINNFKIHNRITVALTPNGKPFDFPTVAVDSLPWLIHSIKVSKFSYHSIKPFLNLQIKKFYSDMINPQTGLVKPEEHFSSIKDLAIRKSSCYDNCVVAMLANDLKGMKLYNPFNKFDYADLIKRHFWSGEFFYDDLQKKDYISGDANLFPFILGIISDKEMMQKSIEAIEKEGLDNPFPLKYTTSRKGINFIWEEIFLRNYESSAIWMHTGPLYVKLLQRIDAKKAREYKKTYGMLIEKHGNFLEVFNEKGKPFSTPFYYCDSGMLWAANYLTL
ncbi:MAG: hypothetical protein Q8Q01_01270 [archaeon]|nr:hypothetical protein [archaeon]